MRNTWCLPCIPLITLSWNDHSQPKLFLTSTRTGQWRRRVPSGMYHETLKNKVIKKAPISDQIIRVPK
jgi:hypothetical protein